jgi:hypothetical protein
LRYGAVQARDTLDLIPPSSANRFASDREAAGFAPDASARERTGMAFRRKLPRPLEKLPATALLLSISSCFVRRWARRIYYCEVSEGDGPCKSSIAIATVLPW